MRPDPLRLEEVTSAAGLEALRPEWEALWASSPRATPFQHPAWLLAWWRHLGAGELRTLAVRGEGRLAGLWPMFVWADSARQLTPLGNGVSDHVDLLAAPGAGSAVAAAVFAALAAAGGWDTADFRDIPADSPLFTAALPAGLHPELQDDEPCPVLALPASRPVRATDEGRRSGDGGHPGSSIALPASSRNRTEDRASPGDEVTRSTSRLSASPENHVASDVTGPARLARSSAAPSRKWTASGARSEMAEGRGDADASRSSDPLDGIVPRAFLKKMRYHERRLDREFAVKWQMAADPSSLETLFGGLVRLHAARWAEEGTAGMLDDPRAVAFHRHVAKAFLARGMLRLHALRLDGALAAAWYGFAANGRTYYYLGGFDPRFERFSVGTVIVGHALEHALAEGATELDFLRGREAYKYAWGAVDRPQRRIRLTRAAEVGG